MFVKLSPTKKNLAEKCAQAERYIGTEGGGMDQAIIFNAKRGTASLISFDPLRLLEVQIPPACTFVIAQSMVQKNKAASNDFNSRVVECRLASLVRYDEIISFFFLYVMRSILLFLIFINRSLGNII